MKTVCGKNQCVGCYACHDLCPKGAITINDKMKSINAEIDNSLCVNCNLCHTICQVNHPIEKQKPIAWYQGWNQNPELRAKSSSGGAAAELSKAVVLLGGVVFSCAFSSGQFRFCKAESVEELDNFKGSKYVKSNPTGVYKQIRALLRENRTVLFIGLPCQCAAVRKVAEKEKNSKLYLVDLICHGSPSPQLLEYFLEQYHLSLDEVKTISFREKGSFSVRENARSIVTPGTMDCYSIAFLDGLSYTENCYNCQYADSSRVGDITIGDSWGSELSDGGKGISLILCNTPEGKELVDKSGLYLTNVDLNKAIAANPQLSSPATKPAEREKFFDGILQKKKFNYLVMLCCKKKWLRQFVKRQLIRLHLIPRGGGNV